MKKYILLSLLSLSALAQDIQLCEVKPDKKVLYESATMKITFVNGAEAQKIYEGLDVKELPPRGGDFDQKYIKRARITGKKTESHQCWKINPPKMSGKKFIAIADCFEFSCNITEKK
jgi:hypothetical protein